jgi:hypothetical protein
MIWIVGLLAGLIGIYRYAARSDARSRGVLEPAPSAGEPAEVASRVLHSVRVQTAARERSRPPVVRALSGRVSAERGGALAGAHVCLAEASRAALAPACASSDVSGRFELELAGPGPFVLLASLPGYLPLREVLSNVTRDVPLELVLRAGGARTSGEVLDASGGTIAGASLSVTDARGEQLSFGVSDATGHFELAIPEMRVRVAARAEGYSEAVLDLAGPVVGLRVVLAIASSIVGRVITDEGGEPVAGATVTAFEASGSKGEPSLAQSREDGGFVLSRLPAGRYSLVAVAEHWRSEPRLVALGVGQASDPVELRMRAASQLTGSVSLDGSPCERGSVWIDGPIAAFAETGPEGEVSFDSVPPGHYRVFANCVGARPREEALEVGLEPLTRLWEMERGLTLSGIALSAGGAPLAGAAIDVFPARPEEGARSSSCTSDELGKFSCSGLDPAEYDCSIGPGMPRRSEPVRVRVGAGGSSDVVLRAYAEGTLEVRIAGAERFDLPALNVVARREREPRLGELRGDRFVFDSVPLGRYVVSTDPPAGIAEQSVEITQPGAVRELTLSLPAPHAIVGRVVDDAGQALPDAWVRATSTPDVAAGHPSAPVLSAEDGSFSIEGLLPGRYALQVTSELGDATLDAVPSDRRGVIVQVSAHGSLSGTVATAAGDPVAEFVVAYRRSGIDQVREVKGSRGSWAVPWLTPGTYELRVAAPEGEAVQSVELRPRDAVELALQLAPTDH